MKTRASILMIASLMLCGQSFPIVSMAAADAFATIVKMDNKRIFIPETKLTRSVNPVSSFLYIGSWEGGQNAEKSFCSVDLETNQIHIKFSGKLLEGSRTRVVTQNNVDAFLDGISWGNQQATQIAFKIVSKKQQQVLLEAHAGADVVVFHNGKLAGLAGRPNRTSRVKAGNTLVSDGITYVPVELATGENIINVKQFSHAGAPHLQLAVITDRSHDLQAAWQQRGGLMQTLLYRLRDDTNGPKLEWYPDAENLSLAFEVRDVSENKIVYRKESARLGRSVSEETANLAPGIYEAIYRTQDEEVSEFFVVGNPDDLLEKLLDKLSKHDTTPLAKLDIAAQASRAQILLEKDNYNSGNKRWEEKIAYTFSSLADMERDLENGVVDIAKDQPGLHIRGFASKNDDSTQFYRIYVPSNYEPGKPLPLLVILATRVVTMRPFVSGPVMANQREALQWAHYADKHGFAVLWPGYRSTPEGYTYESMHIEEAIQAVEKDYTIDKGRISVYGSCSAGYNAGRLVSEYPNRFAAIVYDRAVFDRNVSNVDTASLIKWYDVINPSGHVLANENLRIFVMHDNTAAPGHGPMELTTSFLARAKETRDDVVACLGQLPAGTTRMDMVFDWLAPCKNDKHGATQSHLLAEAGYAGPISEVFTTPIIVVEGTRATGHDLENIQTVVKSMQGTYAKYFHGAQCAVKKDNEVTQDDIDSHSLILIGNPASNSAWEKLQPDLAIKMTPEKVLYKNSTLAGSDAFEAIVRNPRAADKYILLLGAGNLRYLRRESTRNLYTAWYDSLILTVPRKIISKLADLKP